ARVAQQRLHAEVNVARRPRLLARHLHLLGDLLSRPASVPGGRPTRVVARPEVPAPLVLSGPPRQQLRIALLLLPDRPVQPPAEIVAPALVEPALRVAVQLAVLVEALDPLGMARPPDPERTDADLDPRLGLLDLPV